MLLNAPSKYMLKKTFFFALMLFLLFFCAFPARAENIETENIETEDSSYITLGGAGEITENAVFEARVLKILNEESSTRENGSIFIQQDLLLKGLTGNFKNQEIEYKGISEIEVANSGLYKSGDRVLVQAENLFNGKNVFYIMDYVRRPYLYLLAFIFALLIIIIGRKKGFRSLIGLIASFFIIIKIILPRILAGGNPLLIGVIGSFSILAVIIYLSEGWKRKSHLAIASVFLSLLATMFLALLFTKLTRLTGFSNEEAAFLLGADQIINFQGLLLAGILIGAVGVLDDIIIGQIAAVQQIREANPSLPPAKLFKMSYKVGNTHLSAVVNTLFLTYAGASLPLLLLFLIQPEGATSFRQVINDELIATEIVRTLVGSIGVALSLPISTYLAAYFGVKKRRA